MSAWWTVSHSMTNVGTCCYSNKISTSHVIDEAIQTLYKNITTLLETMKVQSCDSHTHTAEHTPDNDSLTGDGDVITTDRAVQDEDGDMIITDQAV